MAAGIFISYRRDDVRYAAGRLADELARTFGSEAIFRDIEDIAPGVDFTQSLDKALQSCVVMLVLIGPKWLDMRDAHGARRLDADGDWIRQEIATALQRDVRVVPVLIEGAQMPDASALPPDLEALTRRQALDVSDGRWRGDVQRLVEALERVPGLQRQAAPEPVAAPASEAAPSSRASGSKRKPLLIGAALGVVGLLALALLLGEDESPALESVGPDAPIEPMAADAAVPTIAGVWRSRDGEVYFFEQDGRVIDFVAESGGLEIGDGSGEFDGETLRVTMTEREGGVDVGTLHCDLRAAPDLLSFSGSCNGPDGTIEAHIFK